MKLVKITAAAALALSLAAPCFAAWSPTYDALYAGESYAYATRMGIAQSYPTRPRNEVDRFSRAFNHEVNMASKRFNQNINNFSKWFNGRMKIRRGSDDWR